MRKIITVSREFGSGGREFGKRLAEHLGVGYFDGEVVEALARQTSLDKGYLDKVLENGVTHFPASYANSFSRISAASNSAMLIAKQHNVIKEIAKNNDCVIVGRGADSVLDDLKPFKIFVYADMAAKIARCRGRMPEGENPSDKELEKKIKGIDKGRRTTHDLYSSFVWGDKAAYNLCVNTSGLSIESVVPAVAEIISDYFKN